MKIIPITLPTPFYIGPVNVYLVANDPVTLIDTGPKTREAHEALREGLRDAGFRTFDIRRIVLTHAHEDHCGLARTLRNEAKEMEVWVHDWETGHRASRLKYEGHRALLARAGVPEDEIKAMQAVYESMRAYADELADEECLTLRDNMELEFASGTLRVIHTPGHTPGSCSFVREADRTVIAGDCVLKRITPNPVLMPDPINASRRFRSLEEYLVSLARIRSHAPTIVYGGHGEPVTDYEELFNRYLRAVRERQSAILKLVPPNGTTAWEISRQMFPDASDLHSFLAVSEAAAHLDLAQSDNKLVAEMSGEREYYRPILT
ncbi:MAG: MBL fold metallo-hydrolase [Pyrinomonadaceae bacterium]